MWVLVAVLSVNLGFSLALSIDALSALHESRPTLIAWLPVAVLAWFGFVLLATFGLIRSVSGGRRALHHQTEAIAADQSTSHDWLWESDTDLRLTYSNGAVQELLGYAPDEVVGMTLLSFMTDEDRHIAMELHAAAKRAGANGWSAQEARWLHRDGHPVVLEGSARPIRDLKGHIVGFRGTRSRVTETVLSSRVKAAAQERVRDVLELSRLEVAFQPIVDLATGRLAGVEALARFRDGRGPDEWFGDAHTAGLELELDELAFTAALAAAERLPANCAVSINASPALILARPLIRLILDSGMPTSRIVVEVTEQVRVDDYAALNAGLLPLRQAGVRVAVDDTGAGYASLSHVLQLRPDIIKIDRSLITEVATDAARRSLVTSLVLLALDLGAVVTGEGVETAAELQTLAVLGVDHAQGYLLARPTTEAAQWTIWASRHWSASGGAPRVRV
jgi:PAS domain S-box-containing protein